MLNTSNFKTNSGENSFNTVAALAYWRTSFFQFLFYLLLLLANSIKQLYNCKGEGWVIDISCTYYSSPAITGSWVSETHYNYYTLYYVRTELVLYTKHGNNFWQEHAIGMGLSISYAVHRRAYNMSRTCEFFSVIATLEKEEREKYIWPNSLGFRAWHWQDFARANEIADPHSERVYRIACILHWPSTYTQ